MIVEFFLNGNQVGRLELEDIPQLGAVVSVEGHHWRVVDVEIVYKHGKGHGLFVDKVYIDVEESRLRRGLRRETSDVPVRLN